MRTGDIAKRTRRGMGEVICVRVGERYSEPTTTEFNHRMRVTGGILRGRALVVPQTEVRPTQDKVRAALFSALAAKVPGARVLDLFAGTGALGIEAWSRGAANVCWVERSPRVFAVLQTNVERLCCGEGGAKTLLCGDALESMLSGRVAGPFDLIFADPPYDRENRWNWFEKTLQAIERSHMLASQGVLAYEMSVEQAWTAPARPWVVVRDKRYGGTRLVFLMQGEVRHDADSDIRGDV